MVRPDQDRIGGQSENHVEVDETWVGGKTRGEGRGVHHKTLVAAAVEVRHRKPGTAQDKRKDGRYAGRVRLAVVADRSANSLCGFVRSAVIPGSLIVTDDWSGYSSLGKLGYDHHAIAECGDPDVAEEFMPMIHLVFSNLKTWLNGIHHGVSEKHLQAYLNEFTFRFNRDVFGDSAYRSAEAEEKLAARGFRSRICVRGTRGRPLSKAKAAANRAKSRIRARIEHVFGAQETAPGGRIVRTIGIVRARMRRPWTAPRTCALNISTAFTPTLRPAVSPRSIGTPSSPRAINALRGVDADRPDTLDPVLRRRLAYTSSQSVGRSRPRDAYSPFVARQLRDAAKADVAHIIRRLQDGPVMESDAVLRRVTATVHGIIAEHGRIGHDHPAFKSLYFMRLRRSLPVSRLIEDVHGRHYLTAADLPPFLVLLSLETGLEIECCKALTIDCLRNASAGVVDIAYVKRRARGAEHKTIKVRDGGVGTPGGLIRRVVVVTAAARRHHSSQGLWVHHRCGALTDQIGHSPETIDAWTRRHGIVDDDGRPLHLVLFSPAQDAQGALVLEDRGTHGALRGRPHARGRGASLRRCAFAQALA